MWEKRQGRKKKSMKPNTSSLDRSTKLANFYRLIKEKNGKDIKLPIAGMKEGIFTKDLTDAKR